MIGLGQEKSAATWPGLLGNVLWLAVGFPHKLEKESHCLHGPANGCPAANPANVMPPPTG